MTIDKDAKRSGGQRTRSSTYLGVALDDILLREQSAVPNLVTKIVAFIIDKGVLSYLCVLFILFVCITW